MFNDAQDSTQKSGTFTSDSGIKTQLQEQILNTIPLPLLVISDRKLTYGNSAAGSLFRVAPGDLIGMPISRLSPRSQPDGRFSEQVADDGVRTALNGTPWSHPWEFRRSDQSLVEVGLTLTRIGVEGEVAVLATILDTSGEIRHQQEMEQIRADTEQQTAWYESILDSIKYPITVTDMDQRWTFVNKAVLDMLKVTRSDIIGHPCSEWGKNICNTADSGINQLKSGSSMMQFVQSDGHFPVDCSYLTDTTGNHIGHVEVITDVTRMIKIIEYFQTEIDHLAKNLRKLADG
ncbi:MAG: PAS domain-containing protein, partial [Methanobacteriota archaeon]